MSEQQDLNEKVAVVTGGCGGLGQAIAQKLTALGARVVITDLDEERGTALTAATGCQFFQQDVSREADWLALKAWLIERFGGLHVLVNNAAILRAYNVESETLEDFNRVMAVNCQSVFLSHKHLLGLMAASGGSIVNISSSSAMTGHPQFCAYTASKAAVRSLTMNAAVYARKQGYGVRCNSVHPDGIITPMVMNIPGESPTMSDEQRATAAGFTAHPEAIADVVVFLASDDSRHINGAAIAVDNTSTITPPYV